jgi:hypothetical protein
MYFGEPNGPSSSQLRGHTLKVRDNLLPTNLSGKKTTSYFGFATICLWTFRQAFSRPASGVVPAAVMQIYGVGTTGIDDRSDLVIVLDDSFITFYR